MAYGQQATSRGFDPIPFPFGKRPLGPVKCDLRPDIRWPVEDPHLNDGVCALAGQQGYSMNDTLY